eukprot:scaffold3504_cov240-Pinguiococcus_pyrenoidosus.AAC.43
MANRTPRLRRGTSRSEEVPRGIRGHSFTTYARKSRLCCVWLFLSLKESLFPCVGSDASIRVLHQKHVPSMVLLSSISRCSDEPRERILTATWDAQASRPLGDSRPESLFFMPWIAGRARDPELLLRSKEESVPIRITCCKVQASSGAMRYLLISVQALVDVREFPGLRCAPPLLRAPRSPQSHWSVGFGLLYSGEGEPHLKLP